MMCPQAEFDFALDRMNADLAGAPITLRTRVALGAHLILESISGLDFEAKAEVAEWVSSLFRPLPPEVMLPPPAMKLQLN